MNASKDQMQRVEQALNAVEKAQPFDEHIWQGFNGAESWYNDDPPVYRTVGEYFITADRNGIEVHLDDKWWLLNFPIPTQKLAMAFLNGLPEDFDPQRYGFDS